MGSRKARLKPQTKDSCLIESGALQSIRSLYKCIQWTVIDSEHLRLWVLGGQVGRGSLTGVVAEHGSIAPHR